MEIITSDLKYESPVTDLELIKAFIRQLIEKDDVRKKIFEEKFNFKPAEEQFDINPVANCVNNWNFQFNIQHLSFLLKIYGSNSAYIDYPHMYKTMKSIHYNNKRIYISFKNGHLENYIPGLSVTQDNLKENFKDIATSLAYMHSIEYLTPQEVIEKEAKAKEKDSKGGKKADPKKKGKEAVQEAEDEQVDEAEKPKSSTYFIEITKEKINLFLKEIIAIWYPEERSNSFRRLREYISYEELEFKAVHLLKYCMNSDSKIVFGHNDLSMDNMVLSKFEQRTLPSREKKDKGGKDKGEAEPVEEVCLNVQFVDFEYAGFSTLAYDIGNFFNSCPGFYPYNHENGFPDRDLREIFYEEYLSNIIKFEFFKDSVYFKEYKSKNGLDIKEEEPAEVPNPGSPNNQPVENQGNHEHNESAEKIIPEEPIHKLDTKELEMRLKKYKYDFLDVEVLDWCKLSHLFWGLFAVVQAKKKQSDETSDIDYESLAISRLKCLDRKYDGKTVVTGDRKFGTTLTLNGDLDEELQNSIKSDKKGSSKKNKNKKSVTNKAKYGVQY